MGDSDKSMNLYDRAGHPAPTAVDCGGAVFGVLDIDSPRVGRFDEKDRAGLEAFAAAVEEMWRQTEGRV